MKQKSKNYDKFVGLHINYEDSGYLILQIKVLIQFLVRVKNCSRYLGHVSTEKIPAARVYILG